MTDRHVRRTGDDYTEAFLALLPQGQAWPKDGASVLTRVSNGLCQIWGLVDGKAADLLEIETDPRTANVMLDEWERAYGLPDNCIPFPPTTLDGRRDTLVERITMLGRQDRQFFIDYADRLGQNVGVREYSPYQCGISGVGDTRVLATTDDPGDPNYRWGLGPAEMRFYWKVDLTNVLTGIECIFRRYKPAHTSVVFTYSSVLDRSSNLYPWLMI